MKKLLGLSQLEKARSWDCAVRTITSFNRPVDHGTAKYVIF
jgi:hypothetical protein